MKVYLDTSTLVALLSIETQSVRVQRWLSYQDLGSSAISHWCVTEFSAALSFKVNSSQMTEPERIRAQEGFARTKQHVFSMISVEESDFKRAAIFANQARLCLRSGDSLHLAIAAGHSLRMATLDRRMADAARQLGIGTVDFSS